MNSRTTTYATALVAAWETAPAAERTHVVDRFADFLDAEGARALAPRVIVAVERLLAERDRRRAVTVEVAHELHATQHAAFVKHGATHIATNEHLIGGFRLQREGSILDASVRGGLEHVRNILATD